MPLEPGAPPGPTRPVVVWRFLDGKPGHENQTLGLLQALQAQLPIEAYPLPAHGGWRDWMDLLLGRCRAGSILPPPDLLLGAGHGTHARMLACRRAHGGRAVVLMRPSLPNAWFDLCVIPQHDGVATSPRIFLSRGVLNPIRRTSVKDPDQGLMLVGGPSSHYGWDDDALRAQLRLIAGRDGRQWTVATSRRTPDATIAALRDLDIANLQLVDHRDTAPGWLAQRLQDASAAWVTEDSVSMLYEALTAGCACGVLPVPVRRSGRVRAGLQQLLVRGDVGGFAAWREGEPLRSPPEPFDEAARCAHWIRQAWFAH